MIEESKSDLLRPPGSSEEDNAPVNVDAILQSILGRGGERFGMAAAVLRGERIIAQVAEVWLTTSAPTNQAGSPAAAGLSR